MKILVPVDFTPISILAAKYALHLSSRIKAELTMVHVFLNPLTYKEIDKNIEEGSEKISEKLIHHIDTEADENLEKFMIELREYSAAERLSTVILEKKLLRGIAVDEILNFCKHGGYSLIILGVGQLNKLNQSIFGSVSRDILKKAPVPVLFVPPETDPKNFGDSVYLSELDEDDVLALNKLNILFEGIGPTLSLLHIGKKDQSTEKNRFEAMVRMFKNDEALNDIRMEYMEADSFLSGYESYVKQHDPTMVAVTTHKRSFFENLFRPSLSSSLLEHVHRPFLVFHHE